MQEDRDNKKEKVSNSRRIFDKERNYPSSQRLTLSEFLIKMKKSNFTTEGPVIKKEPNRNEGCF